MADLRKFLVMGSLVILGVIFVVPAIRAQIMQGGGYEIIRDVLDVGGGPNDMAGGVPNYKMTHSFGQPGVVGKEEGGSFELQSGYLVVLNTPPGEPEYFKPDNEAVVGTMVTLVWNVPADADGDALDFKLEISTLADFSALTFTRSSWLDYTGFEYETAPGVWAAMTGSIPQGTGLHARFTMPAGVLVPGVWYYWRVSAWDGKEEGSASWDETIGPGGNYRQFFVENSKLANQKMEWRYSDDSNSWQSLANGGAIKNNCKTKLWTDNYLGSTTAVVSTQCKFYYTIDGTDPITNVDDAATNNFFIEGAFYGVKIDTGTGMVYNTFWAVLPEEVHAAGDTIKWQPCGKTATGDWVNGVTWLYTVTNENNDVRYRYANQPKHVQNSSLAVGAAERKLISDNNNYFYFMPDTATVPGDAFKLDANQRTVSGSDNIGDIFYGQNPGLYVRCGRNDLEGLNPGWIKYRSDGGGWNSVDLAVVGATPAPSDSALTCSGATQPGRDDVDPYYKHFNFMRTEVPGTLIGLPESSTIEYYFKLRDLGAVSDVYLYNAGLPDYCAVDGTENIAQSSPFSYKILQDDTTPPVKVGEPTNPDGCSYRVPYHIEVKLEDTNANNTISGQGNDHGVRGDLGDTTRALPHCTRVYYRFSDTKFSIDASSYCITNPDFVSLSTNDGYKDVSHKVILLNGNGDWQADLNVSAGRDKYLYYRIWACNDDKYPQGHVAPSDSSDLDHGTLGTAFGDPYDDEAKDSDHDHGWVMPTRFGGKITSPKQVKITSTVEVKGVKRTVVTYVNVNPDGSLGEVISTEIQPNP